MMRKWIVNGDRTDHGGAIITSVCTDVIGKSVARVGDKVFCPKCKRPTTIISGENTLIVHGQPVAYEGCYTSCGARLVSVQQGMAYLIDGGSVPPGPQEIPDLLTSPMPSEKKAVCVECLISAAKHASAVLGR